MTDQSESEVVQTPTRVGHCKADPFDVYIGRGAGGRDMLETPIGKRGWLGNPHTVDDHGREGSIERFRKAFEHRLENDPEFRARVRDLAGKRLGCWCQRLDEDEPACHGEVIAEHADRLAREGELVTDGGDRHLFGRDTCESCQRDDRPVRSILMKTGDRELLCEQCFRGRLHDDMVDPSDPRVETTEVGDV